MAIPEFIDENIQGVDLSNMDLEEVIFRGCDLRGTDFRGANLRNAKMLYCDLRETDFRGAIHENLDLTGSVFNIDPYKKGGTEEEEYDKWARTVLAEQRLIYEKGKS